MGTFDISVDNPVLVQIAQSLEDFPGNDRNALFLDLAHSQLFCIIRIYINTLLIK